LTGGWIEEVYASGEFAGKALEVTTLHRPGTGAQAKRIALIGAGKASAFSEPDLRKAAAFAVRTFKTQAQSVAIALDPGSATPALACAAVEGVHAGAWEQDVHKSANRRENKLTSVAVVVEGADSAFSDAIAKGNVIGESQSFARDLINEPGNILPPRELVRRGRAMAEESGLSVEVLDQDRMKQLGMGSLLGVAMGSAEPAFLMVIRYQPERTPETSDHLGLVGKGVTFDTGGISIKPSDGMEKMKNDMAGAGAMLGAMRAIARLKPSIPVTAFIPTVENMPGSRAQRPGDIVTSLAGKTIEVLNTDAEGRLILIDAITYAKRQGCTHLVDAATLTGAIGVALGAVHAGAFTNNEAFLSKLMAASKPAGESLWHMPAGDEYREQLKSPYADIANIGGRAGGSCTAAVFLKEWVEDTPWIHLDIAYTAYLDDAKPHQAKGATGFGVRSLVNLALNW